MCIAISTCIGEFGDYQHIVDLYNSRFELWAIYENEDFYKNEKL